ANGDIADLASAWAARRASGCHAVMVGRAAQGRPWLLAQIAAGLAGRDQPPAPSGAALSDLIAAHYEAMLSFYGLDLGLRVARKHLAWYCEAMGADAARRELVRLDCHRAVLSRIAALARHAPVRDAA
ncbi:MAG: tRNA dihydrouridine synthase DusB, partial [Alphaproteobacteria bacterium]